VSIDVAESSSIENSLMLLNQSKDSLERRMNEVGNFTRQLAINEDLTSLISDNPANGSYNLYRLRKTSHDVSNYVHTNEFLQDFYIYLKNYNVVLNSDSVFFRPDHFYEINHYNNVSAEQWKKTILEENHQRKIIPLRPYTSNKKDTAVITYVQSLPLNSFNQPGGTAVVTIDQRQLSVFLERISSQFGGWAYIADNEGNPITMVGINESQIKDRNLELAIHGMDVERILDDGTLLISTRSDSNGWVYVAGIPKQGWMGKSNAIKEITWTATAGTLLIGIFICLFLAYRNSAPIHSLMELIKEQIDPDSSKHSNEYDFLRGKISNLISNNKSLQEELKRQVPLLKDGFIKRLINGEFNTSKGGKDAASQTGIEFRGDNGYVGILQIKGYGNMESSEIYNELNIARLIIKQAVSEIDPNLNMTDLGSDKIAVIFSFSTEHESILVSEIEQMMLDLSTLIQEDYRLTITISMGGLFRNYLEISRSYDEAKQTMDYAALTNSSGPLWYQDIEKETTMFYYPIDMEIRFLNALKVGEVSETKLILDKIFKQNFDERDLSTDMAQQLIGEIKASLFKSIDSKVIRDSNEWTILKSQLIQLQLMDGIKQIRHVIENIIETYCSLIENRKKEADHETVKIILKYVEDSYGDPDLSLYSIAEKVGRPEKFISQLFKEQIGVYLSEYLEKVRIQKASELLLNTDKTIEEISHQSGYNSPHSFRRAFKRVSNVTPKMYRQTINSPLNFE
jgi:two-component system response regulator YesN